MFSLKVGAALDENPRCLSCFALTSYHPPPFLLTFFSFSYSPLCLAGCASVVIPLSFYLPLLCHHLFLSLPLCCLSFLPACFTSLSPLFSPSVFIFHHLWIVCTLLFLWSLNIFFGSLELDFLSLCVMLLPCIPLFSLVFFLCHVINSFASWCLLIHGLSAHLFFPLSPPYINTLQVSVIHRTPLAFFVQTL